MVKPFHELRERLLQAGIAPRHVRRYLTELSAHLADLRAEEERAGRSRADAEAAALVRIGAPDDLARAMIEQPQFQSWSARAPWAVFGLVPLCFLFGAYFVSCFILWAGWQIFLPQANTPFGATSGGHIFALQNLYFQADKFFYFTAPILTGWGIGLIAARQRVKAIWPILSFFLLASMGGTAQIHANRTILAQGLGHISMSFFGAGAAPQALSTSMIHVMVAFTLSVVPYLIWLLRKARLSSA